MRRNVGVLIGLLLFGVTLLFGTNAVAETLFWNAVTTYEGGV